MASRKRKQSPRREYVPSGNPGRRRTSQRRRSQKALNRSPRRKISVEIPVPVGMRIPGTVYYTYPNVVQRRNRRVKFALALGPYTKQRISVIIPKRLPSVPPSYSYTNIRNGRVTVTRATKQRLKKVLSSEYNRRRYQEHKTSRRRARQGQVAAIKSDRTGAFSRAVQLGYSARQLEDVAMVVNSIARGAY